MLSCAIAVHGIATHKKVVAENLEKAKEKVSSLHEPN
jgi:hypothetical protein